MEAFDTSITSFQPRYLNVVDERSDNKPGREGGDDALADADPNDSKLDEKVIVNEQRSNKTVNAPSQTAANTSEDNATDEELIDEEESEDVRKDKKD